jgi:hypothetical protein
MTFGDPASSQASKVTLSAAVAVGKCPRSAYAVLAQLQRRLRPNPPPTSLRISRSTAAPMKALMIRATMPTPR